MTDAPMPSVDQIQAALDAVKVAIAAVQKAWAYLMPILAWLGVVAHSMAWIPQVGSSSPFVLLEKIGNVLGGNYRNAKNANRP